MLCLYNHRKIQCLGQRLEGDVGKWEDFHLLARQAGRWFCVCYKELRKGKNQEYVGMSSVSRSPALAVSSWQHTARLPPDSTLCSSPLTTGETSHDPAPLSFNVWRQVGLEARNKIMRCSCRCMRHDCGTCAGWDGVPPFLSQNLILWLYLGLGSLHMELVKKRSFWSMMDLLLLFKNFLFYIGI